MTCTRSLERIALSVFNKKMCFWLCCCCSENQDVPDTIHVEQKRELLYSNENGDSDIRYTDRYPPNLMEEIRKRFSTIEERDEDAVSVETNKTKVATNSGSSTSEEWFFENVTRMEVEKSILLPEHENGTFLIRKSTYFRIHPYVLSVRFDDGHSSSHVKHFSIYNNPISGFYIHKGCSFSSLAALVEHYKTNTLVPNCLLTNPYGTEKPTVSLLTSSYKDWEIPKEEISISENRKLGGGNFSIVFHGIWKNKVQVAVKVLKEACDLQQVFKEVKVMTLLQHKNVVRLYGLCTLSSPYWIIQEYLPYGSLHSFIEKFEIGNEHNLYIAYQIADGMAYLESKNIIHRDLATRNILLSDSAVVKISDFGLSRLTDNEGIYKLSLDSLPVRWLAPEIFAEGQFTNKADVWAFGILIIELYTRGQKPYPELKNFQISVKISRGYRMGKPENMPIYAYKIASGCWHANPAKRPSFQKIKEQIKEILDAFEDDGGNDE